MMNKYTSLSKAPITEALIDIRVKPKKGIEVEQLDSIYALISDQYPNRQILRRLESRIEFKQEESIVSPGTDTINGYVYTSSDQIQVVQAKPDGLTFSRLKPYETWELFRAEAYRLWEMYAEITSPELITRVALRYINTLNIPLPIKDFGDYLTSPPVVPHALPQGVSSFLTRVVIHESSLDVVAIITQALEQIVDPNFAPIILDIDVFKQSQIGMSKEDAWDVLEKLRHLKNKIFFESITNKLKELFI
ncbi:MAG: TIGR04255 family protein [Nitrospirae bacterium]|nr:TIGR04255 family protein [Nitrospirota bacterium]